MDVVRGGKITDSAVATGHEHLLDDLDDVTTGGADAGDVLTFNGVGWVPTTPGQASDIAVPTVAMPAWVEQAFAVSAASLPWSVTLGYVPHTDSVTVAVNGLWCSPSEVDLVTDVLSLDAGVFDGIGADTWTVLVRYSHDPAATTQVPEVAAWALNGASTTLDGDVTLTPATAGVSGTAICTKVLAAPASVTVSLEIDGDSTDGGWSVFVLDSELQGTGYLGDEGYGVISPYVGWEAVILSDSSGAVWSGNLVYTDPSAPWSSSGVLPEVVTVTWTRISANIASVSVSMGAVEVLAVDQVWFPTDVVVGLGAWNASDSTVPAEHVVREVSVSST